ncbi:MAG: hypothetical protein K2X91_05855 [Thermoleophilia bacterium]|nr:hypothetical protein [Thermoleophilia bacterium]
MRPPPARVTLAAWALPALLCASCGPRFLRIDATPGELPPGSALPSAQEVVAEYAPVRMEVYALSRLEGTGATRRAVVHLRLLDAYSHDVKWPGVARVEVRSPAGEPLAAPPQSVTPADRDAPTPLQAAPGVYHIDLTGGDANARTFDTISRCYVLRILAPGEGPVLVKARWLVRGKSDQPEAMEAEGTLQPGK